LQIDSSALRRHYTELSDEEFLSIDRADLSGAAQSVYDAEFARRNLTLDPTDDPQPAFEPVPLPRFDTAPDPDWLPEAAIATSFTSSPDHDAGLEAQQACDVLSAAGIPNSMIVTDGDENDENDEEPAPQSQLQIMVPNALALHADNALSKGIFNPQLESWWRAEMQDLSDQDFAMLSEEAICAGYLDLIHRYRRVWREEVARRSAAAHAG
jgi:hypothetical protein